MRSNLMKLGQKIAIASGGIVTAIIALIGMSNTDLLEQKIFSNSENSNNTIIPSTKMKIAASFFPLYDFARNIGGNRSDVYSFLPIGQEPHSWEPSIQQIEELKGTKLFIYNGAGMEAYISKFNSSGEFSYISFVKATQGITLLKADAAEDDKEILAQGGMDPHVWNDPLLAEQEVTNIKNAMEKADPSNRQYYENN